MLSKKVYLNEVIEQMPRLIGLINRNPCSVAYGCFDRQYWHYNTTDFACAECQESVLTLAWLFLIDHEKNEYFGKEYLLEWINGGIDFWQRLQNPNGSFAEWYPSENSMSVTPFSTYAISETLLLLGDKINNRASCIGVLEKAAAWLMKHDDLRVANHYSGSSIALYNLFLLTGKTKHKEQAQRIVADLIPLQNDEGWFMEYMGADVGYASVTLYYLAHYYKKTEDENSLAMIKKVVDFIFDFIHPDGSIGGEYGSRNTEYLIPDGFEIMAPHLDQAAVLAKYIREGIGRRELVSLTSFDDRYLSYLSYMYIQSYADGTVERDVDAKAPFCENFVKEYANAGIVIYSTPEFYCVSNLKKGGATKVDFKSNRKSFMDAGIVLLDRNNKSFYSFYLNPDGAYQQTDKGASLTRKLSKVPQNILSPLSNIFQRIFMLTIGKVSFIEKMVKDILRDLLITNIKMSDFTFSRKIAVHGDSIEFIDTIDQIARIKRIFIGVKASYVYGPSTRFFRPSYSPVMVEYRQKDLLEFKDKGSVTIRRKFDKHGKLSSIHME